MDFGIEVAKIVAGGILGYFAGRATKNRDIMQADLTERAKELRDAISAIRVDASTYWNTAQAQALRDSGRDLNRRLHRMQKLRVHCAGVGSGYRTEYIRDLETRFFDAITGGDFESPTRTPNSNRVELIANLADDLDYAVMGARRADLFLIPYAEIRQLYLQIVRRE